MEGRHLANKHRPDHGQRNRAQYRTGVVEKQSTKYFNPATRQRKIPLFSATLFQQSLGPTGNKKKKKGGGEGKAAS